MRKNIAAIDVVYSEPAFFRKGIAMARSTKTVPHWSARIQTFPTIALWQLRETWRLLLVTGAGIMAAVVLVCAVPLYSQISMTAELRDFLSAHPTNSNLGNAEIAVHSDAEQISPSAVHDVGQQLERVLQNNLGTYLSGPTQFSFQTTGLPTVELLKDKQGHISSSVNANQQMRLVGASITQAASDRKSTRLNSSHANISYAVFCLTKK